MRSVILIACLCVVLAAPVVAQTVQWASSIVDCSLPVLEGFYGVTQVLGKPNVLPAAYHAPCAWVIGAKEPDGTFVKLPSSQSITVSFDSPMQVQQIAVAESY